VKKIDLIKYAEEGVRVRLLELQAEWRQLLREFPQLAPASIETASTPNGDGNGHVTPTPARAPRQHVRNGVALEIRVQQARDYLRTRKGGVLTVDLAKALGISKSRVMQIARAAGAVGESTAGHARGLRWHL
jgi:hypothetical protein